MSRKAASAESLVYVLRPDRTALWLPEHLAASMAVAHGSQLTQEQFSDSRIQQLISDRSLKPEKPEKP